MKVSSVIGYLTCGLALVCCTNYRAGSSAACAEAPKVKEAIDLELDLRCLHVDYQYRGNVPLNISLINKRKEIRTIDQLPTTGNMLGNAQDLLFVFRFENGDTFVVPSIRCNAPKLREPKALAIGPLGESAGFVPLANFFHGHPDLDRAFDKCAKFGVTAIIRPLELKSQTLAFNGYQDDRKGADALKDAEEFFKKKKDKGD